MEKLLHQIESNEKTPELNVYFSTKEEVFRLKQTQAKLAWYKEQGYRITVPVGLDLENATIEEIERVVSLEFDESVYKQKQDELEIIWGKERETFIKNLATLGLPIQKEYLLSLTRYGVGGSYGLPNRIQMNFNYGYEHLSKIIFHEIIHLTIEQLIKDHNIEHWTKERLIDLIFNKFFPNKKSLQRNPENSEHVQNIFDEHFPNITKIISLLSKPQ